ncbi:TPA: tape measure protein [Escherichia coli]|uniref:tape measure protein n=1 Tax=Escherichia coli TaxID=562 RepID=UPI0004D9066B|nr:tape measure protein [Escherichia coli]KDW24224.1 tape measure domain protein [Escherichia coli 2-156-04_S4_C1]HEI3387725.1 tape measure protein [Escherichia coli]
MASEEQVGNIVYQVQMDVANLIEAQRKVNERLEKMNSGVSKAASKFDELQTSISRVAGAIAASIVVEWGKAFLVAADNMSQLNARIERLTGSASVASQTMQSLMNISSTTGGSLQDTAKLWETLSTALRSTGATNGQILQLTDTLQKIGRIGGTSAEEMANALRQFGQSISSGVVRAEEFNSILEQMPELARQMAAGLGIGIGELRQLMLDGKLSAQDALNAIQKQTSIVNAEFAKLPRTLSQANAALTNSFLSMVDSINQTTGASRTMVAVIDSITTAIDRLTGKTASAAAQISDLNSTAEMFERRARTWSWLGLDGWEAQSKALAGLSNKAAALVGDISAVTQASQEASNTKPINIKTTGDDAATSKLIKNSERRLALAKLEGEARARLQAQYDAADAGITDQKRIKALQDEYAETYRVTEARKESNKEGKTSASQAESIAQKLASLKQQSELAADSTSELSREQAMLRAEQSLGSAATQSQIKEAREYAARTWDVANALKMRQQAEQASRFINQEVSAAKVQRDPYTGEAQDPAAQVNEEEQRKLEALAKYQELGVINAQQFEDGKTAIARQASNDRISIAQQEAKRQVDVMNMLLGGIGDGFSGLAEIVSKSAGESNAAYKTLFAISKAFAVAQSTLNLQLALSNAMASGPFPWNMAAMAQVAAAGGQVISSIGAMSYGGGREHGGPVSASSMYRVGEGGKPEIFKASNGSQYMIPGDNGRVISNRDIGGGGGAFNYSPVIQVNGDPTEQTLAMLEAAVKRGAQQGYAMAVSDVASGKGKLSNALTNNFNTSQRLT